MRYVHFCSCFCLLLLFAIISAGCGEDASCGANERMHNGVCVCVYGYERVGGVCVPAGSVDGDVADADAVEDTEGDTDCDADGDAVEDTGDEGETGETVESDGDVEAVQDFGLNRASRCLDQFGGEIESLTVNGNYLYILAGPGLLIYDISNPYGPALVQKHYMRYRLESAGCINSLAVNGDNLLVASDGIVDPRKPENDDFSYSGDRGYFYFTLTDGLDPVLQVVVDGEHPEMSHNSANYQVIADPISTERFLADSWDGVQILDIRNGVLIYEFDDEYHNHFAVGESHIFTTSSGSPENFKVWRRTAHDIELCASIEDEGSGTFYHVAVDGDFAYVYNHGSDLYTIDISYPCFPAIVDVFEDLVGIRGIHIMDNYLLVPVNGPRPDDGEVILLDISDPGNYFIADTVDIRYYYTNRFATGNNSFFYSHFGKLDIYHINEIPNLEKIFEISLPNALRFVFPGNVTIGIGREYDYNLDYVGAIEQQSGMPHMRWQLGDMIIQTAERLSEDRLALIATSKKYQDPLWEGRALVLVDISLATGPAILGHVPLDFEEYALRRVSDNMLAVAIRGKESWVRIYDISVSDEITEVGLLEFTPDERLRQFAVHQSGVGLALFELPSDQFRYDVLDMTDPGNITKISSFPSACKWINEIDWDYFQVDGDLLLESCHEFLDLGEEQGVALMDISDTSNVTIKAKVVGDISSEFAIYKTYMFVVNGHPDSYTIRVYDINTLDSPEELGKIKTPGTVETLYVVDDILYMANDIAGLSQYDLTCLGF